MLKTICTTKKAQRSCAILPSMFCRFDSCLGNQTILKKIYESHIFLWLSTTSKNLKSTHLNQIISIKSQYNKIIYRTMEYFIQFNKYINFLNNKIISAQKCRTRDGDEILFNVIFNILRKLIPWLYK